MNCRDIDNLLDSMTSVRSWPIAAREHLEKCERCRALASMLESDPEVIAAPSAPEQLFRDLKAVEPPMRTWPLCAMILLVACGIAAVLAGLTGFKGFLALSGLQRAIILPSIFAFCGLEALLYSWEMHPGRSRPLWLRAAAWLTPFLLLAVVAAIFIWNPDEGFTHHALLCLGRGLSTAVCVAAAVWLLTRNRAYFVHQTRAGLAIGALAGMAAFFSQELYCSIVETAHITAAHISQLILAAAAGATAATALERMNHR